MALTIAALPVGGGTLAICPMPGRGGAYAADLADLRAFAPALVISMTPAGEMALHGAGTLAEDLARAGIGWLHLPVADFGAPGPPWPRNGRPPPRRRGPSWRAAGAFWCIARAAAAGRAWPRCA